jgi:anti-sigma regulatory factor (Ser/Thr protein kinase)
MSEKHSWTQTDLLGTDLLAARPDLPEGRTATRYADEPVRDAALAPFRSATAGRAQRIGEASPDEWPLRDSISFSALPSAVPCARLHARLVLAEWGHAGLADPAELVVSELMTNAVTASQTLLGIGHVRLWLLAGMTRALIAVWDANPRLPRLIDASDLAESGRGLHLVDAIALRWEAYAAPNCCGKIVQALITAEEPHASGVV